VPLIIIDVKSVINLTDFDNIKVFTAVTLMIPAYNVASGSETGVTKIVDRFVIDKSKK